jgi:hypothetical protein
MCAGTVARAPAWCYISGDDDDDECALLRLASLEFCLLINSADEIEIWCPSIPQQRRRYTMAKRILESDMTHF